MKKIAPLFLTIAACLWAADFWLSKPYTDWSDKEIQKIETNSPWSKQVPVSVGQGGGAPNTGRAQRGSSGAGGDIDTTGTGGAGGSRAGGRQPEDISGGTPGLTLIVSWRTALPVREAVAKEKFGAEAATSADAKKLIEEEQKFYMILVSGLSGRMRGGDKMKESLLHETSLIVKGKDPIQASDLQFGGNEQKAVVLFIFPKTIPLSLDDKDVEFSTKVGSIVVRQKFRLKDMVFNGKLDL